MQSPARFGLVPARLLERTPDQVGLEPCDGILQRGRRPVDPVDLAHLAGKQVDADPSAILAQYDEAADALLEFADVAAPFVVHQHTQRLARDPRRLPVHLLREARQEAPHQKRDVLAPLAQRRDRELEIVQAVVEVLQEVPRADRRRQIGIRRADEPHIRRPRLQPADGPELAAVEQVKQLRLDVPVAAIDFIEEQGPPFGLLDQSSLVADRPGERALHVAEELAFEELLRQRRAVDSE